MTAKQKTLLWAAVLLLTFAALKAAGLLLWQKNRAPQAAEAALGCDPASAQGCTFSGSQSFRLAGVGGHKTPFAAEAAGLPPETRSVSVSFEMAGMDMGFNRFELSPAGGGRWRAEPLYLPLCSANRHDWTAVWQIDGRRYRAPFQTRP